MGGRFSKVMIGTEFNLYYFVVVGSEAGVNRELSSKWLLFNLQGQCSATKSYPTLCDPMICRMAGFPALHCLLKFAQTHVH